MQRLAGMLYDSATGPVALVAHHAPFDLAFLNAALRRHGLPEWEGSFICTRSLAALLVPGLSSRRLPDVAAALVVPVSRSHRALDDARVTAQVLGLLLERAARAGMDPLNVLVAHPDRPLGWVPGGARLVVA